MPFLSIGEVEAFSIVWHYADGSGPAEHYVQQLWEALDMTHQMAECGIGSDTPVGQGGTLDTVTLTIRGANAPMSVKNTTTSGCAATS